MKFSLLPIFYISLTVASAIPTSKSTRGLRVRDNESIDLSISLSCAQDGLDAAVAFKTGGEKIYNKFKGVVHDEVKRDTSSPEVTGALTKRDLAQCISCVSDAIIRRMSEGEQDWARVTEYGAMDCNPSVCSDEQMLDVAENIQLVGGICATWAFAYFGFGQ